ncbi:MAG: acetyl-CoA carboxylase, carboxyltransferase subunit beta [Kiloniellales bacterium]
MNWISDYVRPRIRSLIAKQDVPENLWEKCDSCGQMIFHRELEANLRVCTNCGHHMRIGAERRLKLLFDEGDYQTIELPETPADPLKFRDRERYSDRLKKARSKTGHQDALLVAHGTIGGHKAVVACFDFGFMGGSMGIAVGEALVSAARLAVLQEAALIAVPASGGARMQEGILSLMQLPRSVIAVEEVKEAGLPYFVLLTDPTTGGVSASFAMLGDIQISEPGAVIGFAGQRVIEETIRESLPEGFQRAEYLRDHGMIDMVVERKDLNATIGKLLSLLTATAPLAEVVPLDADKAAAAGMPEEPGEAGATQAPVEADTPAPDDGKAESRGA